MTSPNLRPTRRTFLAATATLTAVGLAGCAGDDTPAPAEIDDDSCVECGMVLRDHPGPVGQAYFDADADPSMYCSSSCTYRNHLDRDDEPVVTYLTDYSTVDYEVTGDESLLLSAHFEVDAFEIESELDLVVASDVEGAMGPSLVPFSDSDDATAFQEQYGGDIVPATEVSEDTMSAVGR